MLRKHARPRPPRPRRETTPHPLQCVERIQNCANLQSANAGSAPSRSSLISANSPPADFRHFRLSASSAHPLLRVIMDTRSCWQRASPAASAAASTSGRSQPLRPVALHPHRVFGVQQRQRSAARQAERRWQNVLIGRHCSVPMCAAVAGEQWSSIAATAGHVGAGSPHALGPAISSERLSPGQQRSWS